MNCTIKRTITTISIAAFFLLASAAAFSQPMQEGEGPGGMRGRRGDRIMDRLTEELGLSPEQQQQLKEQKKANNEEMKRIHEQLRDKRGALHEQLQKPVTDEAKVNKIVSEMKALQSEQLDQRINSFLGMKEILTPEQFEKFISLKDDAKERWRKKRDRGRKNPRERFHRGF